MNRNRHILLAALAAAALTYGYADAQTFAANSILANGNWTKVAVTETGLYEISYAKLREMGFSDPSKVAVYGQGGRMYGEDLYSNKAGQIYADDLLPVGVLHSQDKLFFYGLGVDNIEYKAQSGQLYFDTSGLNIYTTRGYYFLTDSAPVRYMEKEVSLPDNISGSLSVDNGLWYTYHEVDLQQGHESNGQLFWGEDFSSNGVGRMEWDADMRDALPGKEGILAVEMYKDKEAEISLNYGLLNGTGGMNTVLGKNANLTYLEACKPRFSTVTSGENTSDEKVYIDLGADRTSDFTRLDYWVLTYRRGIPTLAGNRAQDAILFDNVMIGENRNFIVGSSSDIRALQISDPRNVTELTVHEFGPEGRVNFTASANYPSVLLFNPGLTQLQIGSYEKIGNQNLHAEAAKGADLLIITTNDMKEYAEMHADVHRNEAGLDVVVADLETLYNEFSGGRPDPMAYRGIASMMYRNQNKPLKNILFYGPATGNIRQSEKSGYPYSRILLMHNRKNRVAFDHGASTIFDFAGITANEISHLQFENTNINVGVGYLTVKTSTDAEIARNKVRNYITDKTRAYWINRMLAMGCDGDNHNHEEQAIQTMNAFNSSNYNGNVTTTIMVDDNGNAQSGEMLLSALEDGVSVFQYMGHAGASMLGQDPSFHVGQITQLRNRVLPVIGLAGCDLTLPDRGMRGIAERLVLDTEHGGIGCISTNRQAWSGPNVEFAATVLRKWGWTDSNPAKRLEEPQTLGQVYARAKTSVKQSNELAYMLIGDPAVQLPTVSREIYLSVSTTQRNALVPGYKTIVNGTVNTPSGEVDENFNGEAVVRILEPALQIDSRSYIKYDTTSIPLTYDDFQAAMGVAKVENGRFSLEMRVPEYMNRFEGKECRIAVGAYDNDSRRGAAGALSTLIATPLQAGLPQVTPDTEAPVIASFEYDAESHLLSAYVSDNVAVSTTTSSRMRPAVKLLVDGRNVSSDQSVNMRNATTNSAVYEFLLPELDYGSHTATLEVADQAGNRAAGECRFVINPSWAKITLVADDEIADGKVSFNVEGAVDSQLTLHILDADGVEIFKTDSADSRIEWNCRDNSGEAVQPGIYRAYVRESGRSGYRAHSAAISVAVI